MDTIKKETVLELIEYFREQHLISGKNGAIDELINIIRYYEEKED